MARHSFFCIDGHTCGNPVRLVAGGGPNLNGATMIEKRAHFLAEYDWIRTGLMFEPRGHDIMSGSILYPPPIPIAMSQFVHRDIRMSRHVRARHHRHGDVGDRAWLDQAERRRAWCGSTRRPVSSLRNTGRTANTSRRCASPMWHRSCIPKDFRWNVLASENSPSMSPMAETSTRSWSRRRTFATCPISPPHNLFNSVQASVGP